jgi:hypothetical protein
LWKPLLQAPGFMCKNYSFIKMTFKICEWPQINNWGGLSLVHFNLRIIFTGITPIWVIQTSTPSHQTDY